MSLNFSVYQLRAKRWFESTRDGLVFVAPPLPLSLSYFGITSPQVGPTSLIQLELCGLITTSVQASNAGNVVLQSSAYNGCSISVFCTIIVLSQSQKTNPSLPVFATEGY